MAENPMTNEREAEVLDAYAAAVGYERQKQITIDILLKAASELTCGDESFARRLLSALHPSIDALLIASGDETADDGEYATLRAMEDHVAERRSKGKTNTVEKGLKNLMEDIGHEPRLEPPEPRLMYVCDDCGEDICRGDVYYRLGERVICDECIADYANIAGEE